jgi:hypothetical protein
MFYVATIGFSRIITGCSFDIRVDALLKHKQAGNPVCTLKDGKVVWIAPEDIKLND